MIDFELDPPEEKPTIRDTVHELAWKALRIAAIATAICVAIACGPHPDQVKEKPDVVLITLDTTRADHLSCYGYERATTPNLDALAEDAQRFDAAYAVSSWTLPSHASIFTGKFPSAHGARYDREGSLNLVQEGAIKGPQAWRSIRARPLSEREITLAQVLREGGYTTGAVVAGPWLKRGFGLAKGFDHYDDQNFVEIGEVGELNGRPAEDVTRAAVRFVDAHADEPFFLFLNYFDPHTPWRPRQPFRKHFWPGAQPEPPTPEFHRAMYDAEIQYMDHHLGRFLDHLKREGLYENAWIIVTADHGELMGEDGHWGHGGSLSQAEILTPLIIKEPGAERPRGLDETPIQQVDLMPTLLARLGLPHPPRMQGSVFPEQTHPIIAEVYPLRFLKTLNRDLPWNGDWRVILDGPYKFAWNSRGEHALYDLARDPTERDNLRSRQPRRVRRMARELTEYLDGLPEPGELGEVDAVDAETRELLQSLGYLEASGAE